jgi:peptidyl-prolyl cis-trans isomerase D
MLKVLRENVKYLSWILWVIIGLFVLFVFVDFGTGVRDRGAVTWAAKVGSDTVSQAEFQRSFQLMESRLRQMYGDQYSPEVAKQMQVPLQALNQAVSDKILLREARRIGLRVGDDEVSDEILEMPVFKDDQGRFIGQQQYTQILQQNRFTVASFEDSVREDLLKRKLAAALAADLYISESEIERTYRDQVERAKIRYIEVPRTRFADVAVPPAEVAAYFQQHRQEYRLPDQREADYLLVEPSRMVGQVQIPDAELQDYYNGHQDEFKQDEQVRASHILLLVNDKRTDAQARQQLEDIKNQVEKKGEDFGAAARKVSEDPGSKANGGDLGFFGHGRMVKEFEQAAFSAPVGQLVGPIKSSFGYHLLKVTGRRGAGVQPFAEVREQIRTRVAFERARQLAETKAKDLATRVAAAKPKSAAALQEIVKNDPTLTFNPTGRIGPKDPLSGLGLAPELSSAIFAAKQGDVTKAVEVPRGWAVAWVEAIHPAHLAEQAEVEGKVREQLTIRKQQDKLIELLTQDKTKPFDQVATELGIPAKESPEFSATGSIPGLGAVPQLTKLAMTMPVGQVGGPIADSRGAVLFQVSERKAWEPAKFAAAKDQTLQTLRQQRMQSLLSALLERRRRELGVDYNRQLLEKLGVSLDGLQQPQAG